MNGPESGQRSVVVPAAASKHEVLVAFGKALHLPEYYGTNLDALNDCLQDLASELANGEGEPLTLEWHVHPAFRRDAAYAVVKGILVGAVEAAEGTLTLRILPPDHV
ncbi:barstar family protein [Sinomonas sp. P10A9]|uniref:Barstar family protein n=1 Tax=Sinomonas puerhi TaxID=3238584 RepID=A0AB39L5J8_9MICC